MSVVKFYAGYLDKWNSKENGPKPTVKEIETIHALGPRPGKQAFANAMYLRPAGATNDQVIRVIGKPQRNKKDELVELGLLKQELMPKQGDHMVYKTTLTPKGAALVKGKEVKAPKAKKAKKRTAKKPVVQAPALVPADTSTVNA